MVYRWLVWVAGFEPTTSGSQSQRSSGLSYTQLLLVGKGGIEPPILSFKATRFAINLLPIIGYTNIRKV